MNNEKMNNIAAWIGMNVIIKYKYLFFIVILALFIFGFKGMDKIVVDSSNESFFSASEDVMIQNERFKEIFGNEEFVFVYIEADDVFQHDALKYIRDVSQDIEKNLPFVKEVNDLSNIEFMEVTDDALIIDDLIGEEIPEDNEKLKKIKSNVLSKKIYIDKIITKDARATGIAVSFKLIPDFVYLPVENNFNVLDEMKWPAGKVIMKQDIYNENTQNRSGRNLIKYNDPRKLIAPALKVILDRHKNSGYKMMATGVPVIDFEADRIYSDEAGKFGLLALIASVILLIVIFRDVMSVIAPVCVLFTTMIILYGLLGWFGMPMSMMSMLIPVLILVISVSYSIHVINHFKYHFKKTGLRIQSVEYSFKHAAWPCFVTAATTAVGFASFIIVPIIPIRNIGIICAMGVFLTYFLTIIIVPSLFSFGKNKSNKESNAKTNLNYQTKIENGFISKYADFVFRNSMPVIIFSIIGIIILSCGLAKINIESDMIKMLGTKSEVLKNSKYIAKRLGGLYSYEILIELPEPEMAKEPTVLKTIDSLSTKINNWESTAYTGSIIDIVKDINMTMHNNNEIFYSIPDNRNLIAQYFLLYEMSGGENIEDWIDYAYQILHISVQSKRISALIENEFNELKKYAVKNFPEGTKISMTGDIPIGLKMIKTLSYGQIKSIFIALFVITVMMIFILKSIKLGLISMIPNIMPVIVVAGVMGFTGIPLDMLTVIIAPMIIGIAVDDTVHYLLHFKQEFSKLPTYSSANKETFHKVGKAITFTSVILITGFAIFGFSIVNSMVYMGILSAIGIFAALIADLLVTPVIIACLQPFGKD